MINLDSPDILTAQEAAKIWDKNEAYVRTALKQNPDKFPDGSVRRFGKVILVTTQGMEAATGIKDSRVVGPDGKSNKIKKAEQINSKTNNIEVIDEKEFIQFISK